MELKGVVIRDHRLIALGVELEPNIRTFEELIPVLRNPERVDRLSAAYYMYRDLPHLRGSWARFDLTLIPHWVVGDEHSKTHGHYHLPGAAGIPFPEVYQVFKGEGLFLLQKCEGPMVEDFVYLRGRPGDVIIIPPWYGHVTVNPGPEPLLMGNLIYRLVKSDYEPFRKYRGAAFYYTLNGFVRNENYEGNVEPREVEPFHEEKPIVDLFLENPSSYEWLRRPELLRGNPLE